jgi:type II secretory pathway pseudopilin PulG
VLIRDSLFRLVKKSEAAKSAESAETAAECSAEFQTVVRNEPRILLGHPIWIGQVVPRAAVPKRIISRLVADRAVPAHGPIPRQFPRIPRIPRPHGPGAKPRRGISLLEAVVAIAIVGMTAVSALEAAGGDMRAAERSRRAIEAEALATSRLDFMDLLTDRELQALPDSVEKGKFDAPLDEYSWKTTSTPLADQAGVYTIRVTVDWPSGSYTLRSYAYRTPPFATRR